jgi:hypothetical protein
MYVFFFFFFFGGNQCDPKGVKRWKRNAERESLRRTQPTQVAWKMEKVKSQRTKEWGQPLDNGIGKQPDISP